MASVVMMMIQLLGLSHSRHSDSAKKTTSPSMLLSLDRPSPGAAAAATLLLGDAVAVAVVLSAVVVGGGGDVGAAVDDDDAASEDDDDDEVPLAGESPTVRVKLAGRVDVAETVGRLQVVVAEEVVVQSTDCWAMASGRGLVFCAWARLMLIVMVVAPRAARV